MYKLRSVRIRTMNSTARPLRQAIFVPFLSVCRLGSRTATDDVFPISGPSGKVIECNTVEAIENSRDKLRMKECFDRCDIPQADYYAGELRSEAILRHFRITRDDEFQLVGKSITGFQGKGMVLIQNRRELDEFCRTHTNRWFFVEKFYNYGREYRIHATRSEGFLSWRKLRRQDATERWFFNSHNCNWVGEQHRLFDKPANWEEIKRVAANAIHSVGLDIGAVDIRIQSKGDNPQYIVCEVNSAPALGDDGVEHYKVKIKEILMKKHNNR